MSEEIKKLLIMNYERTKDIMLRDEINNEKNLFIYFIIYATIYINNKI